MVWMGNWGYWSCTGAVEVCDVSGGGWADTRGYIPFSILLPVDILAPEQQHGAITFIH